MTFITIFSCPKPFTDPHIATIQRNAICSWKALGDEVEVILLGDEVGIEDVSKEIGVRWIPDLERNENGTPLVSSMLKQAQVFGKGELLGIVNSDIILFPDFIQTAQIVKRQSALFLLLGQRWDIQIDHPLSFGDGWQMRLLQTNIEKGVLHKSKGSDYFIFPRNIPMDFPPFAIGRAGWDNWTIFYARKNRWQVIDSTHAITAIHQQHDYSHLPGGKIHYDLPESNKNLRLGGGKRHVFTLLDTNYRLDKEARIKKIPFTAKKMLREIEIWPVLKWDQPFINDFFFYLTNPRKFIRHKFPWIAKVLGIKGKIDEIKS